MRRGLIVVRWARRNSGMRQVAHRRMCTLERMRLVAVICACTVVVAMGQEKSGTAISTLVDVHPDELSVQPPGANWLSYNGDYTGRRYTGLEQINRSNVNQLRAEWVFHLAKSGELEVTPVVFNGVMFVT